MKLTRKQREALVWIDTNSCGEASWRRDGKLAYGAPHLWSGIELVGVHSSIFISTENWEAIREFVIPDVPEKKHSMWLVTEEGKKAILAQ